jgi:hypothetical protein
MMTFCGVDYRGTRKHMGRDNGINSAITNDFVEDMEVIRGVEGIVQKGAFQGKLRGFIYDEAGGTRFPPAHVEMGYMYFVTLCQFFKNIMVAGWNRVMNIILSRNKEDLHTSHDSGSSVFSLNEKLLF